MTFFGGISLEPFDVSFLGKTMSFRKIDMVFVAFFSLTKTVPFFQQFVFRRQIGMFPGMMFFFKTYMCFPAKIDLVVCSCQDRCGFQPKLLEYLVVSLSQQTPMEVSVSSPRGEPRHSALGE